MFDLFREIAQTLSHNKLRTALTGIAVAWGIFMLIVLLGLANGLINSFNANMLERDTNSLSVFGGYTTRAFEGYREGRQIKLKKDDLEPLAESDREHIGEVTGVVENDTVKFATSTDYISGGYSGVYPSQQKVHGLEMLAGRFINDADLQSRRKSLVINDANAMLLFGSPEAAIGQRLKAMGLSWTIVGVYHHDWQRGSFVPFTTAVMLGGDTGELGEMVVDIKNMNTAEEGKAIEGSVRQTLGRLHSFDPEDDSALWVWNRFSGRLQAMTVMNILVYMMWVIGILTLLSGIIGVSNIMFVSVRERTHEIGIRRAIGARRGSILRQVVMESVVITTLAGYVGIVFGTAVMALISHVIGDSLEMLQNPTVDLKTAIEVTVVLIVAGALAGLFPALKATKVKPVEALRDE